MASGKIQAFDTNSTIIVVSPSDIPEGMHAIQISIGTNIGGGKTAPANMRGFALRSGDVIQAIVMSFDGVYVYLLSGWASSTWSTSPKKIVTSAL